MKSKDQERGDAGPVAAERGPLTDKRWLVDIHSVPQHGVLRELTATEAERSAVAKALDLQHCDALDATCDVKSSGRGRFRIITKLVARVTQTCVVTLEPLDATVSEHQTTEFWPAGEIEPRSPEETIDEHNLDIPTAIEGNSLDLGQLVYELLATSLELYPRKPGAVFDWRDTEGAASANPFASLAKGKRSDVH